MINKEIVMMLEDFAKEVNKKLPIKKEFEIYAKKYRHLDSWDYYVVDLVHKGMPMLVADASEGAIVAYIIGYCSAFKVDAKAMWQKIVMSNAYLNKRL